MGAADSGVPVLEEHILLAASAAAGTVCQQLLCQQLWAASPGHSSAVPGTLLHAHARPAAHTTARSSHHCPAAHTTALQLTPAPRRSPTGDPAPPAPGVQKPWRLLLLHRAGTESFEVTSQRSLARAIPVVTQLRGCPRSLSGCSTSTLAQPEAHPSTSGRAGRNHLSCLLLVQLEAPTPIRVLLQYISKCFFAAHSKKLLEEAYRQMYFAIYLQWDEGA